MAEIETSCDASYLELDANPCPRPFTLGDAGRCDRLIEDHLAEQGPSRAVYMAYFMGLSVACLGVQLRLLHEVWCHSAWSRMDGWEGVWGFLKTAGVRMRLCFVVALAWMVFAAIDPQGLGGRLPFWLVHFAEEQATTALILSTFFALQSWYEGRLLQGDAITAACHPVLRLGYLVVVCLNGTVGPLVTILAVPNDAPAGVWNSKAMATKVLVSVLAFCTSVGVLTAQYLQLMKTEPADATGKTRMAPRSSRVSSAPQRRRRILGRKRASAQPPSKDQAGMIPRARCACTPFERRERARAPVQVHQFVVAAWITGILALYSGIVQASVGFAGCWAWMPLKDEEWGEMVTTLQLASVLIPTLHLSNRSFNAVTTDAEASRTSNGGTSGLLRDEAATTPEADSMAAKLVAIRPKPATSASTLEGEAGGKAPSVASAEGAASLA